ncbi:tRNA (adenosine(37)-N6)-threonylcarbamoyltransferase complex ATPase subunit type 1 TsaE [Zymobacter palmae]|uniref:tRNA threonylcarbamoyladenosine biosynthesis protein TsaE n=1 Tax=Zymobacter palmae TaxID=33074 RepID=A0A348HG62_9GAMM|nr:tRNA (adenosine(37)-N6)-threonylcarbamoyltransferase complex ATPase subunit type 1 TsaE [Zymobacter palmae]BBG30614.1 predicted ATPase or kinase [Zymobacter palmae]
MTTQQQWQRFRLPDEDSQIRLGRYLGEALRWQGHIWLEGDLGAGKTTLTRGILRGAGHDGAVKSPTYTLLEPYDVNGQRIHHFDLYRLGDPEELAFMGARELFEEGSLNIIEWPSMGEGELPTPDLVVTLTLDLPGRIADVAAHSVSGEQALVRLRATVTDIEVLP